MDRWPDTETTLHRFRQWLVETRAEVEQLPSDEHPTEPGASEGVGLLQLVEEFTALRHDAKLQTKSVRGLAERLEPALAAMQQAAESFSAVEANETEAARRAARPLVEALMELDEALARGRAVIDAARRRFLEDLTGRVAEELDNHLLGLPAWRRWLCASWCRRVRETLVQRAALAQRDVFDSLLEGYDLIVARLQRAMKEAELYRIECAGRPVDPNLMNVVEAVDDPLRPPGIVLDVVRPGYYWKGKVLRFAEVRAVQGRR
jgi:molecular chaperone GrpE